MGRLSSDKEKRLLERDFEAFFMAHFPKVKHFAWKLMKSEDDAEDIAQEVFLKLWDMPAVWRDGDAMDSYLYRMTRNKVIDQLRKHSFDAGNAGEALFADVASEAAATESPLSDIYYKEIRLILKLSLEQMPPQRRRIFEMSRTDGMSNREIAEKLQLSVRTVEHHLYLAVSELKKKLIVAFLLPFL